MDRRINSRPPADTPEAIAYRMRRYVAGEKAIKDREARYPQLTAENADEAIRYQDERISFYMNGGQS